MASRSRTDACLSMSSAVALSLAGARVALVEALVVVATPRVLLRAHPVPEASARQLDLVGSEAAEDSVVVLAVAEVVAAASAEAIVVASEEALVVTEAAVEVDLEEAAVASVTKVRAVTARPTVLLPVLEDHEVGLAATAEATAATAEETATAEVTGAEEAIEDPAALTMNRSVETDTTNATAIAEAETAMAAETIRGNARTRATATTTGASAGGTRFLRKLEYVLRWVCHRLPPISSLYLLRHEDKTKNVHEPHQHWRVSRFTLADGATSKTNTTATSGMNKASPHSNAFRLEKHTTATCDFGLFLWTRSLAWGMVDIAVERVGKGDAHLYFYISLVRPCG